jgi:hypothetical protein
LGDRGYRALGLIQRLRQLLLLITQGLRLMQTLALPLEPSDRDSSTSTNKTPPYLPYGMESKRRMVVA